LYEVKTTYIVVYVCFVCKLDECFCPRRYNLK